MSLDPERDTAAYHRLFGELVAQRQAMEAKREARAAQLVHDEALAAEAAEVWDADERGLRVGELVIADRRCCIHNETWHEHGACEAPGCACAEWRAS